MTPKEKAEELINSFRDFADGTCPETDRYSPNIEKQKAKQCAIISVDEIIKFGNQMGIREPMMYWHDVIKEINKL